jgi:hypothetical protein
MAANKTTTLYTPTVEDIDCVSIFYSSGLVSSVQAMIRIRSSDARGLGAGDHSVLIAFSSLPSDMQLQLIALAEEATNAAVDVLGF